MAADTGYTKGYAALRAQIGKNRMALAYERAQGTFKALQDFTEKYAPEKDAGGGGGDGNAVAAKPVVKTYKVLGDARGNERPEDIDASGGNAITVEGDGGTWLVTYRFSYPSRYLIKGGGDLAGKNVRVIFEDGKATGVSCNKGSGVCEITGFKKR